MDCQKIALEKTNRFSQFFIDYISSKETLKPFFGYYPTIENFKKQIEAKASFPKENRTILTEALESQYAQKPISDKVKENIDLLKKEKTFTITTGHQLNIFTGPLYFIFKIVTVINACTKLKQEYPEYNFVPVYWMATEDHDFEEISSMRVNGKKYTWKTDQKGAVGHFDPSSIKTLLDEIPGIPQFFKDAYSSPNLAEAVRHYVNHLFGEQGLVIIDGDDSNLKKLFAGVIEDDVFNHTAKNLVDKDSVQIEELGYNAQIFPRDINFFYLDKNLRERVEHEGGNYGVINTGLTFTAEEIHDEIKAHPEKFSPNVVLRPLYQEMVLPNLAYVGGPAEMVYWLQLKSLFGHYQQPFPILLPRNFGMVIPHYIQKKIDKAGLGTEEIFQSKESLLKNITARHAEHSIHLNGQMASLQELFETIKAQAEQIDPTLGPHVEAQKAITTKRLEIIEKKFLRAEKRNQSTRLRQVEGILDFLFPNGGLQERTDNFLNFYQEYPSFIQDLFTCFDPFDYRFHIINYGK